MEWTVVSAGGSLCANPLNAITVAKIRERRVFIANDNNFEWGEVIANNENAP
jgi:hypothetical protein